MVNTSIRYNHVFKPSMIQDAVREMDRHEISPIKKEREEETDLRVSPTKLSEEYASRNQVYEMKIREMMKELHVIKQSISVNTKKIDEK